MSSDFARLIEERRAVEFVQRDVPGSFTPPEVTDPPPALLDRMPAPVACAVLLAVVILAGALMFAAIIYGR